MHSYQKKELNFLTFQAVTYLRTANYANREKQFAGRTKKY